MSIFSYHLLKTSYSYALQLLAFPINPSNTKGLIYAETMSAMTLGSPILSTSRILIRQIAIIAQWKDEKHLESFLKENKKGIMIAKGWHTRLLFTRKWGKYSGFKLPAEQPNIINTNESVIAVTIAKMKLPQVPRFINWGRPVEKLVRDHPSISLALASTRLPNTVSTFSVWKNTQEMEQMVHGHSSVKKPKRHINAMKERSRKNFHYEFTTLRFKILSEFGKWEGKTNFTQF